LIGNLAELPVDFGYALDQEVPDYVWIILWHTSNKTGFEIV